MPINPYQLIFLEARRFYRTIGPLPCKILNNEHVLFSRNGFEHLIRKNRKLRPINDQIRRFKLLKHIHAVINLATIFDYREIIGNKVSQRYSKKTNMQKIIRQWTLCAQVNKRTIKIVIQQEGLGKKHFLSIM